jgi:hypothetical protein
MPWQCGAVVIASALGLEHPSLNLARCKVLGKTLHCFFANCLNNIHSVIYTEKAQSITQKTSLNFMHNCKQERLDFRGTLLLTGWPNWAAKIWPLGDCIDTFGSFWKIPQVAHILGFFRGEGYASILTKNGFGYKHFGQFFQKFIWSPWCRSPLQGCKIFPATAYQKGKIYQITFKCTQKT